MFERYTEKARRVIFFARYEASQFGSPYIESEFLLLGMVREDRYFLARWLSEGDRKTIRSEIEKHAYPGPKSPTSVDLPLSGEAKNVLKYAAEEAGRLKHQHIGTEHLFLGLLHDRKTFAAKLLLDRGVKPDTVRETLAKEGEQTVVSRVGTGTGRAGSMVQGRSFQVQMIPEDGGKPVPLLWGARIPAVGEIISLENNEEDSGTYQVVKVEWKVTTNALGSHSLAKALVHVRELKGSE